MKNTDNKKIAVIGVSGKTEKFGYRIFKDLIAAGYIVSGVNPADGEVLGRRIYRSLREVEGPPDLVITVVPPQVTERVVEECRELGIREIWMQPGSESQKAVDKAKEYGITATYNTCFMVAMGIW